MLHSFNRLPESVPLIKKQVAKLSHCSCASRWRQPYPSSGEDLHTDNNMVGVYMMTLLTAVHSSYQKTALVPSRDYGPMSLLASLSLEFQYLPPLPYCVYNVRVPGDR